VNRIGRRRTGFTLIEVMGVIVVMGLILGFATDYYIDLSRASNRASRHTHDIRHATAIIDRIARDFESTLLLVKADDVDPLDHPWLFLGEAHHSAAGSDHIKFVTRNFQRRRSAEHESDLALVAYTVRQSDDANSFELHRWSTTQLPESLDRSFPPEDDDASFLLADGLADFGVIFHGDGGESDTWDSTTLIQSGQLPTSVEIRVSMADPDAPSDALGDGEFDSEELVYYSRRVRLPVRPIDLAALLDPEKSGQSAEDREGEEDEDGGEGDSGEDGTSAAAGNLTMGECLDLAGLTAAAQETMPSFSGYVEASLTRPWSEVKSILPAELRAYILPKPGCQ
jgi:prepilin-type N-terminal cleavage/methylation domain-containing protein